MAEFDIDISALIDEVVNEAFKEFGIQSLQIKKEYYLQIKKELDDISKYFIQITRTDNLKTSNKLTNPYAPEFGFSTSAIAYQITKEKKDQAIIYNKINKILSFLRQGQEINYALYIKDINGRIYRREVPESEIGDFTRIVQENMFKVDEDLRNYAETSIEKLENALKLSEHIEKFMAAVDSTGLKVKLPDKYEAYEYHYQTVDNRDIDNLTHGFNIEGIRKWILGRGHDTAGWWVRGDIGLTSVKSVNLNNKFLLLNLASEKSLQEVYQVLTEVFINDSLNQKQVGRLVKAFTPIIHDFKQNSNMDVQNIVNDLISSLIEK